MAVESVTVHQSPLSLGDPRSAIRAPTSTDPTRRKPIDRKPDYVLSYSHRDFDISTLYRKLDSANSWETGQTLDAFTKRTALFSGLEVKPASGDHTEAELQRSTWIAASLRNKQRLARIAQASAEPAFTIFGHEHPTYYTYPREYPVSGEVVYIFDIVAAYMQHELRLTFLPNHLP